MAGFNWAPSDARSVLRTLLGTPGALPVLSLSLQTFLPNQAGSATNLYSSASRLGSTLGYLSFGAIAGGLGHRAVFLVSAASALVSASIVHAFRNASAPGSELTR